MANSRIYTPYSRLVRIRILDRWFEVPENNVLLRCFQYIAPDLPYGPYCWNGECRTDRIRYRRTADSPWVAGLSCQTMVREGMEIEAISPELARSLASAFQIPEDATCSAPPAAPGGTVPRGPKG